MQIQHHVTCVTDLRITKSPKTGLPMYEFKGDDGIFRRAKEMGLIAKVSINSFRKRFDRYGLNNPLVFYPGRIPLSLSSKYPVNKSRGNMPKLSSTRHKKRKVLTDIPEPTSIENELFPETPEADIKTECGLHATYALPVPSKNGGMATCEARDLLAKYNASHATNRHLIQIPGHGTVVCE